MYKVCLEGIQPCNMKNRDIHWRRYKKHCNRTMTPSPLQSRYLGTSHSFPSILFHSAKIFIFEAALSYFPESHEWSEISTISKVIWVFTKARSCRAPNLGCSGVESSGWFDVSPQNSAWDVMHEQVHCRDEGAYHQVPIVVAFCIIWIVFTLECSSLKQHLM